MLFSFFRIYPHISSRVQSSESCRLISAIYERGKKYFYCTILTVLLFYCSIAAAADFTPSNLRLTPEERAWLEKHPRVRLSFSENHEPILIVGPDGELSGILVDYLDLLNSRLDTDFSIIVSPPGEDLSMIEHKAVEGILALHPQRAKKHDLLPTVGYHTALATVYVNTGGIEVDSIEDLSGRTVSVVKGTYFPRSLLKPLGHKVTIVEADTTLEALRMLFENKVDAMLGLSINNYLVAKHFLSGIQAELILSDQSISAAMAINPDLPELVSILNKGITSITNGEVNQIISRWTNLPTSQKSLRLTDSEQAWLDNNPVLRLGYDIDWPPVEYVDQNGSYQGISAEYMGLLAESLGITIEPVPPQSWQTTIEAAKSGKIDILPALMATPQRQDYLSFTKPYLSFPMVIVTDERDPYVGSLSQLKGKRIAVVADYSSHEILQNRHPGLDLFPVRDILSGLSAVKRGDSYAFIGSLPSISHVMSREGVTGLKVTGETPYRIDISIAVLKDKPLLAGIIEKALDSIPEQRRNEIFNRWISIKYEYGFDYTLLWRVLAAVVVVFAVILIWNKRLNTAVSKRTRELKESEESLRKSESRFRLLYENAQVGWTFSRISDGKTIECNKKFAQILGYETPEACIADFVTSEHYVDPNARQLILAELERAGGTGDSEIQLTRKDGAVIWVLTSTRMYPDKGYLESLVFDITERKQSEEELSKYRTQLEGLVEERTRELAFAKFAIDNAPDAIEWLRSDNASMVYVNEQTCKLLGYSQEEMLNLSVFDFDSVYTQDAWPGFLKELREQGQMTFESIWKRKDGVQFPVEISARSLTYEGDEYFLAFIQDISERKQAEQKLSEQRALLQKILDNIDQAVVLYDAERRIVTWNKHFPEIVNLSEERFLYKGMKVYDIAIEMANRGAYGTGDPEQLAAKRIDQLWAGNFESDVSFSGDRKLDVRSTVLPDGGLVVTFTDITKRKQAEAQLKEAKEETDRANEKLRELDKLKSMFIASMSHELRTPLNSIIGFTGMTLEELSGELNDEQKDNLSRVYKSGKHLLNLITEVIDISKIEAGRVDRFPEDVLLSEVVDEAVGNVQSELQKKGLNLEVEIPEEITLHTDRKRLLQCLLNFLSNSVKYSEKGIVTLKAFGSGDNVTVFVSDMGIGISDQDMPKLFEAFERFESHLRVKAGGTGLGLYLTKKIATEILAGKIAAESIEGKGSTFTITIPKRIDIAPEQP